MLVSQHVDDGMTCFGVRIIRVKDATLALVSGSADRLAESTGADSSIKLASDGFVVSVSVGLGPGQPFALGVFDKVEPACPSGEGDGVSIVPLGPWWNPWVKV